METTDNSPIMFEVPVESTPPKSDHRPLIYLDQNHWSTLAKAIHDPERVPPKEMEPATRLVELAREGRIRVPISASHLSETGKWTSHEGRYRLALTMLELSHGWQMRDPLDVRRWEIRTAVAKRFAGVISAEPPSPFTLDPDSIYGKSRANPNGTERPFAAISDFAIRSVSFAEALVDTMLHPDAVTLGDATGWVRKVQHWTDWLAGEPRDPELRRRRTNAFFLEDMLAEFTDEARQGGVPNEALVNWTVLEDGPDISQMPSLGLYREVFRYKLLNPDTRWAVNDLFDLIYLSCAAGYADYTIGENHLAAGLEMAFKHLGRDPVRIHRRLRDVVDTLEAQI